MFSHLSEGNTLITLTDNVLPIPEPSPSKSRNNFSLRLIITGTWLITCTTTGKRVSAPGLSSGLPEMVV